MELKFLGTGAGVPSKERNVSAIALNLLQELNSIWLFDCGEATQHQILHTSIKPRKINKIFITHLHGDHLFGLPGLLSSRSFQGGESELTVFGPPGIRTFIEASLTISGSHLTYPLSIVEVEEGKLFDNEFATVYCKKLEHGVPSFGYRLEQKDKPGELQPQKLKDLGIPPGPIYQQIKENKQTTLPDGRIIYRKDVVGPKHKGKVLTILGDSRNTYKFKDFVNNSDVLIHEATYNKENKILAKKYYHSTTAQAAQLAKDCSVNLLILTHISSRYQKEDWPILLKEAQEIFPNTKLAHDFRRIKI